MRNMKQYKISSKGLENYQEGNKYCENCGEKNVIWPNGLFDGKTGRPMAWYVCNNKDCIYGRSYASGCEDNGHSYRKNWIFGSSICEKCGKHEPSINSFL